MIKLATRNLKSNEFKERSRLSPQFFTRNRKINFVNLVTMIMNLVRKTTQIEIDKYITAVFSDRKRMTYTKQAFCEARQKLSPMAFTLLHDDLITNYFSDGDFKTYKSRRLLAIDGSILEIPNNIETQCAYGYATNGYKNIKTARALMSALYDLENKLIVSAQLDRYDSSERTLAKKNIEQMLSYDKYPIKNLILFDRGYPSIEFISYLMDMGIDFLMRSKENFLKEINELQGLDQEIEIEITKERQKQLKRQGFNIEIGKKIKIRVVKVILDSGEEETLITNLSSDELNYEEAKELYFKRWGIETNFDELKNRLQLENFSGEKPLIIEQDFYASLFVSNMASIICQDAQEELDEKNKQKQLKYKYVINKNILTGKLKDNLILVILEENDDTKDKMYWDFIKEIERNIVPIRKGRHFERKKTLKRNKYSKSKRKAL